MEPSGNETYVSQVIRQRFPELDASQFERAKEIVLSFQAKNQNRLPSLEGIGRLVKSQPERRTPLTTADKGGPAPTGGQAYTGRRCPC